MTNNTEHTSRLHAGLCNIHLNFGAKSAEKSYLNAKYARFSTKSMPDVVIWKPKSNWICFPWIGKRICYIKVATIVLGEKKKKRPRN